MVVAICRDARSRRAVASGYLSPVHPPVDPRASTDAAPGNFGQDVEEGLASFVVSVNAAAGPPHERRRRVTRYMLLIHAEESGWDVLSEDERASIYEGYGKVSAAMREHGHFLAGDELHPSADAKVVRVRDDAPQVLDGPFTETMEQLGGYYLVDCSLDEALAYAAAIPAAATGAVEVRPVSDSSPS